MHKRIILLRHGQSTANETGSSDNPQTPLTDLGKQQSKQTAVFLAANYNVTKIISSPFERARNTAQIIADDLKLPIEINDMLIEASSGVLDGVEEKDFGNIPKIGGKIVTLMNKIRVSQVEMSKRNPKFVKATDKIIKLVDGETDEQLNNRCKRIMAFVKSQKTKGDILVVTHFSIIKQLLRVLYNISEHGVGNLFISKNGKQVKNCHITVIADDGLLELMQYNLHLQ